MPRKSPAPRKRSGRGGVLVGPADHAALDDARWFRANPLRHFRSRPGVLIRSIRGVKLRAIDPPPPTQSEAEAERRWWTLVYPWLDPRTRERMLREGRALPP